MATSSSAQSLRVPGRLVKDPTNLAAAFPYGGTELGLVRGLWIEPRPRYFEVTAEEYGGEPVELIELGWSVYVGTLFRAHDNDAVSAVWPNTATGSSSGDEVIEWPGTVRAGGKLASRSFKLLYVPRDVGNHPAALIYKALPTLEVGMRMVDRITTEWRYPVEFLALRDTALSSDNAIAVGKLEDLSLT